MNLIFLIEIFQITIFFHKIINYNIKFFDNNFFVVTILFSLLSFFYFLNIKNLTIYNLKQIEYRHECGVTFKTNWLNMNC